MAASENAKIIETKESEKSGYRKGAIATTDGKISIRYLHEFNKNNGIKLNSAVLIAGFSGPGLVGSIGPGMPVRTVPLLRLFNA